MLSRRDFFKSSTAGGFTLGGLLGLGADLRATQAVVRKSKFANTKEVPSVCPYCGVGCGQLVTVKEGKIINIEGNPESPISRGSLCPKGSATFQLAVNEHRVNSRLAGRVREPSMPSCAVGAPPNAPSWSHAGRSATELSSRGFQLECWPWPVRSCATRVGGRYGAGASLSCSANPRALADNSA